MHVQGVSISGQVEAVRKREEMEMNMKSVFVESKYQQGYKKEVRV